MTLHLLNDDFSEAAIGEIGEIGIETEYLSDGYLNDYEMTQGSFVKLQNCTNNVYLTGDYGSRRDDGQVILNGRKDDQIKVRGFRVELNEVVSALETLDIIQNAYAFPRRVESGENQIAAYLVNPLVFQLSEKEKDTLSQEIRYKLTLVLPSYMVPSHYIWINEVPLLPNGKIDRNNLPNVKNNFKIETKLDNQKNLITMEIISQWSLILHNNNISTNQTFIDLGGDSLSYIRASMVVDKLLGWLPENWESTPIHELSLTKKLQSSFFSKLPLPILIRAMSIVLVVLHHLGQTLIASTAVLFVVAGYSFGKFQLQSLIDGFFLRPVVNLVCKVAFPTIAFILLRQVVQSDINVYNLMLIGTFLPKHLHDGKNFWFIDMLIATLFAIALIFSFKAIRTKVKQNSFLTLYTITFFCMVMNIIMTKFNLIGDYQNGLFPLNYLWLVFFGMTINFANNIRRKSVLILLVIFFIITLNNVFYNQNPLFNFYFICCVLALVYFNNIFIPKFIAPFVMLIASSSLFIYILNLPIHNILIRNNFNIGYTFELLLILAVGYAIYYLWESVVDIFLSLLQKIKKIA